MLRQARERLPAHLHRGQYRALGAACRHRRDVRQRRVPVGAGSPEAPEAVLQAAARRRARSADAGQYRRAVACPDARGGARGPVAQAAAEQARLRDAFRSPARYYDALRPLCRASTSGTPSTIMRWTMPPRSSSGSKAPGCGRSSIRWTRRAQSISRRIHRAHRRELSAAGRRQGAVALSANLHRGGEVKVCRVSAHRIEASCAHCSDSCSRSTHPPAAADAAFTQFIASLWPEAQEAGVSRATFDRETARPRAGLPAARPDPARAARDRRAGAGRVRAGAGRLRQGSHRSRGSPREGPKLLAASIARRSTRSNSSSACRATIVLAIWGRETDYGRYTLPYDAVRVLATQAYVGRRKDQFRNEFILALKMLGEGARHAQGHARVMGRRDRADAIPAVGILQARRRFRRRRPRRHLDSVPDALASAAQQLARQGLAARAALGLRGAARRPMSIARRACPR